MKDLAQRFREHWTERAFPKNGKMLLALSGGIDSMVLGHLLLEAGIPFDIAHCNFSLRGAAADDDSAFVKAWSDRYSLKAHFITFDTKGTATERGLSIQVAARELRYGWFESLRLRHQYTAVLTAHHAGDVAETVLINLSRGCGIAGLHGIPERNGAIIRPLLFATRESIREYAAAHQIDWREDASNAADTYLRNAIRLHILPRLEELLPGAASRIAETAARIQDAEIIYRKAIAKQMARLLEPRGRDWYVPIRLLKKQDALQALAYELFSPFGFSGTQLPQILHLMNGETGRQLQSASHRVFRHRDFLVITALQESSADLVLIEEIPGRVDTATGIFHFSWSDNATLIPDDPNTALLHADDLQLPLVLRTRREGDYFYPLGMGMKKKKIKRFLIDIKTPLNEKDQIRMLECGGRILWVAGKRIDERFKLRPGTKKVLKVVFEPAAAEVS